MSGHAVSSLLLFSLSLGVVLPHATADVLDASTDGNFVLFASSSELLTCLGVDAGAGVGSGELPVVVGECPTANSVSEAEERGVAFRWSRAGLAGARAFGALEVRPRGAATRPICLSRAGTGAVVASEAACGAGDIWSWDDEHRLRLHGSAGAAAQCLELSELPANGGNRSLHLAPCAASKRQQWLALPRGSGDPNARLGDIQFPLRSHGRRVTDALGRVVRLRGVNWYGSHMEQKVNNGLDQQPIERIAKLIRHLGFNHVRLNYAVAMWKFRASAAPVRKELLSANPRLQGKTDLEVFDAVVEALTAEGLLVIVNSHTSDHRWCCSLKDDEGLWYNDRFSEQDWLDSLQGLASRYASNARVIGFDVRNEPRPSMPSGSTNPTALWWGTDVWGNCTEVLLESNGEPFVSLGSYSEKGICLPQFAADWRLAATDATIAVLNGNPDSLVFVEGIIAAELLSVKQRPMSLPQPCLKDRIVWSIHDYTWASRWNRLGDFLTKGGSSFEEVFKTLTGIYNNGATSLEEDYPEFKKERLEAWAFMLTEDEAPVWVGEVGEQTRSNWWKFFLRWAGEMDLDWCYWAIDGYKYPPGVTVDTSYLLPAQAWDIPNGVPIKTHIDEPFGLLDEHYKSAKQTWKLVDLMSIQAPVLGPADASASPLARCTFDPSLRPARASTPVPESLSGFLNFNPQTCGQASAPAGVARRLATAASEPTAAEHHGNHQQLHDEAQELASIAHQHMVISCKHPDVRPVDDAIRERGRAILKKNEPEGPNPVKEALRSPSPEVAQAAFMEMLEMQMAGTGAFLASLGGALMFVLILIPLLTCLGRRISSRGACCAWRPPVGLTQVTKNNRAWRPFLAICHVSLTVLILVVAIMGTLDSVRVQRGVATTQCAAFRGVDTALNGDESVGGFLGLLPALRHITSLTLALSDQSPEMRAIEALMDEASEVPNALSTLQRAVGVLAAEGSVESCPGVDTAVAAQVAASVEWSFPAAIGMAAPWLNTLRPKVSHVLSEMRAHLRDIRGKVQSVRNILVKQVLYFYQEDPIGWAGGIVHTLLLALMAIFLVLIVPTMVFSTCATVMFIFNDQLPALPERWMKRGGLRRMSTQALFVRSVSVRPYASHLVWTSGLIFSVVALGLSLWLHRTTAMGASLCSVLDGLNGDTVREYAPAIGIPMGGDSAMARATTNIILGCFETGTGDGNSDSLGVVSLQTCPVDQVPPRLEQAILRFEHLVQRGVSWFADATLHQSLSGDANLQEFTAGLDSMGAVSCDTAAGQKLLDAMVDAGRILCEQPEASDLCRDLVFNMSTGSHSGNDLTNETANVGAALAALFRERVDDLDSLVSNISHTISAGLLGRLDSDIMPHIVALTDSFDCRFLGRDTQEVVDGLCFEVLVGLIGLRDALFALGWLCLGMAVVMYLLWVRLKQHSVVAERFYEGARKAGTGGTAANCSSMSRRLAQGVPRFAQGCPPLDAGCSTSTMSHIPSEGSFPDGADGDRESSASDATQTATDARTWRPVLGTALGDELP